MLKFLAHGYKSTIKGNVWYWLWVSALAAIALMGVNAYARQLAYGLSTTGMGDEVS